MNAIPRRFHTNESSEADSKAMMAVEVLLNGAPVEGWLGYDLDKQEVYRLRRDENDTYALVDGAFEPITLAGAVEVRIRPALN